MAIDSAAKRRALSGILPMFIVGVTPDATPGVEWRQDAGWGYEGLMASESYVAGVIDTPVVVSMVGRTYRAAVGVPSNATTRVSIGSTGVRIRL